MKAISLFFIFSVPICYIFSVNEFIEEHLQAPVGLEANPEEEFLENGVYHQYIEEVEHSENSITVADNEECGLVKYPSCGKIVWKHLYNRTCYRVRLGLYTGVILASTLLILQNADDADHPSEKDIRFYLQMIGSTGVGLCITDIGIFQCIKRIKNRS